MFELKVQLEVLRNLVRGLYTGLASMSPTAPQALRDKFAALRAEHSKIVLKGIDPAYSDMLSAEYQAALDDTLKFIESGFKN